MEAPRPENAQQTTGSPGSSKRSNGSAPDDPLSLQQHIRIIHETRNAGGGRRTSKFTIVGLMVAAILAAGIWLGRRFGFGLGGDSGTAGTGVIQIDSSAKLTSSTWTPERPLQISIDGMQYKVKGQVVDLDTIKQLAARVPPGDGPAVVVTPEKTSRAVAEKTLKETLDAAGITTVGLE